LKRTYVALWSRFSLLQFFVIVFGCLALLLSNATGQDAHPVWPPAPANPRIRYVGSIASERDIGSEPSWFEKIWNAIIGKTNSPGILAQPVGISGNDVGVLFVADPVSRCVHVFDPVEETYEQIRDASSGWLQGPVGVTCDSRNHLYVSDADAGRVTVYDASFTPLFDISDGLIRPTGLAVYRDMLYVVDSGAHLIRVYDTEGRLLETVGRRGSAPGEFNFPLFLTAAAGLKVVDALNFRIQSFDADMHVVSVFGSAGDRPGTFARPKGIGVDSDGNVYVSDALFDAVQVFDSSGTLLLVFGQTGSGEGEFQSPNGMYIDVSDRIHICDALNGRVQIFEYLKGGTE
ncbi:MAG: hypothetical protein JXA28_02480, partial [Bacteroidetes bacterium]|nr:hypothetical protein [Bacteroidota bacterium]